MAAKELLHVNALYKSLLLFLLNWLDAQLTVLWVRADLATEGNVLMARLLDIGNAPFLGVKLTVGAFAAYIFYRYSHHVLAERGLKVVLGVYGALMFVHLATGMSALGLRAHEAPIAYLGSLPNALLTLIS